MVLPLLAFAVLPLLSLLAPSVASADELEEAARLEVRINYTDGTGPAGETVQAMEIDRYRDPNTGPEEIRISLRRLVALVGVPQSELTQIVVGKPGGSSVPLDPAEVISEGSNQQSFAFFEVRDHGGPRESTIYFESSERSGERQLESKQDGVLTVELDVHGSVVEVPTPEIKQDGAATKPYEGKEPIKLPAERPVEFLEPSIGPGQYTYTWRFGDGLSSTGQTTRHAYPSMPHAGESASYTVYVEASSATGDAAGVAFVDLLMMTEEEKDTTPLPGLQDNNVSNEGANGGGLGSSKPTNSAPLPGPPAAPPPETTVPATPTVPTTATRPLPPPTNTPETRTPDRRPSNHRARPRKTRRPRRAHQEHSPPVQSHATPGGTGGQGSVSRPAGPGVTEGRGSGAGTASRAGEGTAPTPHNAGARSGPPGSGPAEGAKVSTPDLRSPPRAPARGGLHGVLVSSASAPSAARAEYEPWASSGRFPKSAPGHGDDASGFRQLGLILGITAGLLLVALGALLELQPRAVYRKLMVH